MKNEKCSILNAQSLLEWFSENARDLPWRRTRNPYAIWVSEIMLQQTQVKSVLPFWRRWMRELPTVKSLARAKPGKVHKLWEGLGYYTRVRNLQKAAQQIVENHGGQVPQNFEALLDLPGIGRYTAGAICSIAFNQPKPILDGNVIRVLTRLFGIAGDPREAKTNARLWRIAEDLVLQAAQNDSASARPRSSIPTECDFKDEGNTIIPHSALRTPHFPRACSHFNQSLMELGALVCTPKQPRCNKCPLTAHCLALRQGRADKLPNLGRRTRATSRLFAAFVAGHQGRYLVRQRPGEIVNAHLWEFPNVELAPTVAKVPASGLQAAALAALGTTHATLEQFCTIKHSITRYRITLEVFQATGFQAKGTLPSEGVWLSLPQLRRLPFAAAHKRILNRL
jgi:A/G-specific adenine glycosylase